MIKRKIAAVFLGAALVMTGCVSSAASNDYITIGKYKGVEVPKVEGLPEITEDAVDNNIEKVREGFAEVTEVTDRPAREGDTVIVDYTASAEGKVLEGGEVKDYEMRIGANSLFEEFDDSIIGHRTGDVFEIKHTFDKNDSSTSLAGHEVTLKVKIKSVTVKELPDLTDEFVQTISQKSDTVKEYRKEMRELLEQNNEDYISSELEEEAWKAVLETVEVKEYPEDQLKEEEQSIYDHYQDGADFYEMEFDEFLKELEVSKEEFEENMEKSAKSNLREDLTAALIAEKENIHLTDEEYEKAKEDLAKEMSYASVEEMEEEAPENAIRKYILRDRVKEWVADHCIQKAE